MVGIAQRDTSRSHRQVFASSPFTVSRSIEQSSARATEDQVSSPIIIEVTGDRSSRPKAVGKRRSSEHFRCAASVHLQALSPGQYIRPTIRVKVAQGGKAHRASRRTSRRKCKRPSHIVLTRIATTSVGDGLSVFALPLIGRRNALVAGLAELVELLQGTFPLLLAPEPPVEIGQSIVRLHVVGIEADGLLEVGDGGLTLV